jgi:hypothetical protein
VSSRTRKNKLLRTFTQIKAESALSRPTEGRIAIVTDAGRDAVDADSAFDEWRESGRRSRVVLTPRRWCQVGGFNSLMTVTKEPDHRGATVLILEL